MVGRHFWGFPPFFHGLGVNSVTRRGRILMWPCLETWNTNWWVKPSSVILKDYLLSTTCLYHLYPYTLYLYMTLQRTFRKGGWKKCAFEAPDSYWENICDLVIGLGVFLQTSQWLCIHHSLSFKLTAVPELWVYFIFPLPIFLSQPSFKLRSSHYYGWHTWYFEWV